MKRYAAIPLLGALSALAFVGGYYACVAAVLSTGLPARNVTLFAVEPAGVPLTLTIHTATETRTVRAMYSAFSFGDAGQIAIDYRSDRIFCDGFERGIFDCLKVFP